MCVWIVLSAIFSECAAYPCSCRAEVFATLGYVYMKEAHSLMPPKVDLASPEGRYNRARVLRAWMEISITLHTLRLQAREDDSLHCQQRISYV